MRHCLVVDVMQGDVFVIYRWIVMSQSGCTLTKWFGLGRRLLYFSLKFLHFPIWNVGCFNLKKSALVLVVFQVFNKLMII